MNTKLILPAIYLTVFVISTVVFSNSGSWRTEDSGSLLGLGGVAMGYFAARAIKK